MIKFLRKILPSSIKGKLIENSYKTDDGFIMRSRTNKMMSDKPWDFPDAHTPLIVDGVKPLNKL